MKNLLLIFLLLCCAPLMASDANVTWTQPPSSIGVFVDSWNIYVSPTAGTYGARFNQLDIFVQNYSFPDGSMVPNMRNYVVVTAVNLSGESAPSNEANGFPRPVITSAVPVQLAAGVISMTVLGSNLSDDLTTANTTIPGMTIVGVTVVSATEVVIDYTIDPGTTGDANLTISNDWTGGFVASIPSEVFIVPSLVPLPPVIMDVN